MRWKLHQKMVNNSYSWACARSSGQVRVHALQVCKGWGNQPLTTPNLKQITVEKKDLHDFICVCLSFVKCLACKPKYTVFIHGMDHVWKEYNIYIYIYKGVPKYTGDWVSLAHPAARWNDLCLQTSSSNSKATWCARPIACMPYNVGAEWN